MRQVKNTWGGQCDELIFFVNKVGAQQHTQQQHGRLQVDESLGPQQVDLKIAGDGTLPEKAAVIRKSATCIEWLAANRAGQYDW